MGKEEFLCRCKKVPPMEIAQLLEKSSENRFQTMHKDLQTRWGIGLSCTECVDPIKAKLALL